MAISSRRDPEVKLGVADERKSLSIDTGLVEVDGQHGKVITMFGIVNKARISKSNGKSMEKIHPRESLYCNFCTFAAGKNEKKQTKEISICVEL